MTSELAPQNCRSLEVLLALPGHAWVTPDEAAAIIGLSKDALAARRSRGEWPQASKLGPRLIRYRLGEILRIGQTAVRNSTEDKSDLPS
jgi:hypothetical protein